MVQTAQPFIQTLIDGVAALDNGAYLLDLAKKHNIPMLPLPDDMDETVLSCLYTNDDGTTVLYLDECCDIDDLLHELCHIHHLFEMDAKFIQPADMKHRYISMAFREADAFSRQVKAIVKSLHNPEALERETEIYQLARQTIESDNQDDQYIDDSCRVILYRILDAAPAQLLAEALENEDAVHDWMREVFCTALYDYLQVDYEEDFLDKLEIDLNKTEESGDLLSHRTTRVSLHTKEDIQFYLDCIHAYGGWGEGRNYLIDNDNNYPAHEVFLNTLFSPYVCQTLQEMNDHINTGRRPHIGEEIGVAQPPEIYPNPL